MTLEIDSDLPALDLVDVNGRSANTDVLSATGMPVLLVTSALSRFCRALRSVYMEVAALDEGDYQVWMLAVGEREYVKAAYDDIDDRMRVFPLEPGAEAFDALHVNKLPTLIYAGMDNKILGSIEGWDRAEWQTRLNELRALHGLRPIFLPRKLPPAAATLVADEAAESQESA